MANPNPNTDNLKPFTKEHRPKNPGRKPSKLKKYIKENNISAKDVSIMIKNVIFDKNQEQLETLLKDKKIPMMIRFFVKAFLDDFKNGKVRNMEYLLNRAVGQPKEIIDQTNRDGSPDVTEMSHDERKALLAELVKDHENNRELKDE